MISMSGGRTQFAPTGAYAYQFTHHTHKKGDTHMTKYIPYPAYANDAPVDLRFVYKKEVPAGKHGF